MNNSGFSLIEVLISISILSVGVLGITGTQITALDANRNALLRTEASHLTIDLIDRIAANDSITYGPIALGETPASVTDCTINSCSPTAMAAYDIAQWLCMINSTDTSGTPYTTCADLGINSILPAGQASISTIDDEYSIRIQWTVAKTNRTNSVQLYMQIP